MSTSKNTAATLTSLKIGSPVRCTKDGVTGRIVWANGVAVKIRWDDGEQVTWRRDSLATRPIEILALPGEEAAPETQTTSPETTPTIETPVAAVETPATIEPPTAETLTPATIEAPTAAPEVPATTESAPAEGETLATGTDAPAVEVTGKRKRQPKAPKAPAEPKEKKLSALDAAAKILAEAGQPMSCKEMIGAMAIKGYWTSPGGKTPDATLYAAILREISTKGDQARFHKTGAGHFARKN